MLSRFPVFVGRIEGRGQRGKKRHPGHVHGLILEVKRSLAVIKG